MCYFFQYLTVDQTNGGPQQPPQPQQAGSDVPGGAQNYAENVRGQVFTVGPRYTSLQYIGEGAYGMVVWVLTFLNIPEIDFIEIFYH